MKRLTTRRLHSAITPKFLGDASIVERMKIVCCAWIGCCGGDGQTGFAGDKSPEKTAMKTGLLVEQGIRVLKHQHERL
jgi:hypothetical protein